MNSSDQRILEQIHSLAEQIEAADHRHISEELHRETKTGGMDHFPPLSMSEFHVIEYIGNRNATNAVSIAKHLNITRGGISKINQRLISKGLVECHEPERSKRELSYQLTASGEKVFQIHHLLHKKAEQSLLERISKYNDAEKEVIQRFLSDLTVSI